MDSNIERAMAKFDLLGDLRAASSFVGEGSLLTVRSPIDGSTLAEFPGATVEQANMVIAFAASDFPQWRDTPPPARGELVRQIGNEFRKHESELATLVAWETG